MNKRAQLTMMIILGLLLLIATGTVIWVGSTTEPRRTSPAAEQQRLRQIAVQPVRDYVQSCLDVVTRAALELLGKQGGVLYQSQGGLTKDVTPADEGSRFAKFDDLNVSYTIYTPAGNVGELFYATPPRYPFATFPYVFKNNDPKTHEVLAKQFIGYYGTPQFPPLLEPGRESLQGQVESYVNVNLPRCTDWATFKSQGLSVAAGMPNTTALIATNLTQIATEQFFSIVVDWQVNITDLTTSGNTTLDKFTLGYPVRLAQFYLLVKSIVDRDVSVVTFDPAMASTAQNPIVIIRNVRTNADGTTDSIVSIQDLQSSIRGKPLEFRVLRKNRFPALAWLNQTDLDHYRFVPAELCKIEAQNFVLEGNALQLKMGKPSDWRATLQAFDPDEDAVTFHTDPPSPGKISGISAAGQDFRLRVYATDGSTDEETKDYQELILHTTSCPVIG
jgi:hypothetical protein